MLDWTTSFLSDGTIIKLSSESVKQFLGGHYIQLELECGTLPIDYRQENAPQSLRGIDENQEATPVAYKKINPTCQFKKQFVRQPQVIKNAALKRR
jgi:hypothetical protein